ncbi:ABC transporter permease [Lacipirellula limnantheis]|uniref:ABC-2 family transporter protein n=1 Tax=Lacipirellula limnantheis TaxID=2528024 RepID=A0A517TZG0_9BACT|nr:hypothetical protein [Lacipirellula limnantheis]QDT73754.1 hypothetical protein I41_29450 [Lacipirellula limnantheis]
MTSVPPTALNEATSIHPPTRTAEASWLRAWNWTEARLAALAERANPILVKETRQALKSRQFIITFMIVLLFCWIVSFVGIAIVGPQIYYAAAGPGMLAAYYTILIIPLTLVVPFTAFRSLAAEQEENTFDLLSITTLGSRQIVTGKLASALVQMVVYLSAVSPCIAFTFLLRGVDAITVGMLLAVAMLGSVGLSMMALLIGAAARVRTTQVVISVALVLLLAGAGVALWFLGIGIISDGSAMYRQAEFWLFAVVVMSLYVTTFGLLHAAAAAQVAFVSENRSTPLRRWMMAQQACLCGWMAGLVYVVLGSPGASSSGFMSGVVIITATLGSGYWFLMGAMMTGEWPHLSRRVQRSLPTNDAWRPFVSLMNPGPGAGYLFAVANLTMLLIVSLSAAVWANATGMAGGGGPSLEAAFYYAIFAWSYVVAFLGFGRLIINALRKWVYVPMTAAFLIHVILLLSAIGVPTVIQMTSRELRNSGYTLLQMPNPVWTLSELANRGVNSVQADVLVLILPTAALIALLLNLRSVATELMLQRIPVPVRIIEDEAELEAAAPRGPQSPWDLDDDPA